MYISDIVKIRKKHNSPLVQDVCTASVHEKFKGMPFISSSCKNNCNQCSKLCPANAIFLNPVAIDIGKCVFCGECQLACPVGAIKFSNQHLSAAFKRNDLIIEQGLSNEDFIKRAKNSYNQINKIFGRSLKLRSVSAGGCNACELELSAASNVNFDMGRFGIDIAASPRHADGIIITGPISSSMASALEDTWKAVSEPKLLIVAGACAISGGLFANSPAVNRSFLENHTPDLYVPGCPFHPLSLINGILNLIST